MIVIASVVCEAISLIDLEGNIAATRRVVKYAHAHGVSVETDAGLRALPAAVNAPCRQW